MKLHRLSKRESRRLASLLREQGYPVTLGEGGEVMEGDDATIYALGGLVFIEGGGGILPLIDESVNQEALSRLPSIVIDMGAVPHVANGADVMRPGVVGTVGEFRRGDLVVVRDERHKKAIALGRALADSSEFPAMTRGRVAENLHYVGDKKWRIAREMLGRV